MILFEICGRSEAHPVYQQVEAANGVRQYDFIRTLVEACLAIARPSFLSEPIIKALNFQAITCLHTNAGEYRPCPVIVGDPNDPNSYRPPAHYLVASHMDEFVNRVNRLWETVDPLTLGALVLWRLNHIHPFINGNGRTARAASYFVICLKIGGWLPGTPILPELLRRNRREYVEVLKQVDESYNVTGEPDLSPLRSLLERLLIEQIDSGEVAETPTEDSSDPNAIRPS